MEGGGGVRKLSAVELFSSATFKGASGLFEGSQRRQVGSMGSVYPVCEGSPFSGARELCVIVQNCVEPDLSKCAGGPALQLGHFYLFPGSGERD